MTSSSSSQIFAPYRVLGLIAGDVPFVVDRRGTENFLTVACDRTFQVLHCAKLHLVFAGGEHPHRITALAAHGDVAITAAGASATLRLWARGKLLCASSAQHTGRVDAMLVLGSTLLTAGRGAGRTLRLWDLRDAARGAIAPAGSFALDDGGGSDGAEGFSVTCMLHPATYLNKVLLGGEGGRMQLWNLRTRRRVHEYAGLDSGGADVTCLAQAPVVDVAAVGLASGVVALHNLRADVTLFHVTHAGGAATAAAFRTDGAAPVLATGGSAGSIAFWDLDRRELIGMLPDAHDAPVTSLAFLAGEPVLVSAAADNSVKMWVFDNAADPGAARLLRMRTGHAKPPTRVAYYGEEGRLMLSAAQDRSLRLFSALRDQQCVEFSQGKGIFKKAHRMHRETERLKLPPVADFAAWPLRAREWDNVVTCHEGLSVAHTWSFERKAIGTRELSSTERPSASPFLRVAISLCGNFALLGARSGWIEKFNVQSGLSRGSYVGHTAEITGIGTDGLNRTVISAALDGTLRFWDFDSRKQLATIELGVPITHMRINRENNLVAVVTDDARIRVYDAATRALARRFEGHAGHVTDIAFSEDGRWLVSAGVDRTIRTWDLPTGRMVDWFATRRAATSLALSPVGDFLATTHVGKLGISLWVNRMFFMTVLLHPPPPLPEEEELPTKPSLLQDGSIVEVDKDVDDEVDGDDDDEAADVDAAPEELVTLALLPAAKWQTIDALDQIRERNKPKTEKAPEVEVPFFMPTVPGLVPKFDVAPALAEQQQQQQQQSGSRLLALGGSSAKTQFIELLERCGEEDGNFAPALEHLKKIGPNAVDFELRSLPTDTPATLLLMLQMLTSELEKKRNFEVLQAVLRLFLQVQSDALLRHSRTDPVLSDALRKLLSVQKSVWSGLESLLHNTLCLVGYTTGIQT